MKENNGLGNYIIGRNPIFEALESGKNLKKLYMLKNGEGAVRKIAEKAATKGISIQWVDKATLDKMACGEMHQGVIGEAAGFAYSSLAEILAFAKKTERAPLILVLDGVEDPHNLGALIRTCECTGVHGVIIPKRRAAGVTFAAVRASAGATEYVKVAKVTNIANAVDELKAAGLWVASCNMGGETYYEANLKGPLAVVLGNEGAGISRLVESKCDFRVSMPLMGKINSLNVSNAGAVVLYEVLRQRNQG